jgi:hypothetical protein
MLILPVISWRLPIDPQTETIRGKYSTKAQCGVLRGVAVTESPVFQQCRILDQQVFVNLS